MNYKCGFFLLSFSLVHVTGYGNVFPRSAWGKAITIVYAIFGMPLFLLYLSNIGDLLAKSFKWLYAKFCLCKICRLKRRRILNEDVATPVPSTNSWRNTSDKSWPVSGISIIIQIYHLRQCIYMLNAGALRGGYTEGLFILGHATTICVR